MAETIQQMQESSKSLQLMLGGIGGVAMLVAAISICNTMLMSIYERTREIGVMKVLGCELGNIRTMFLLESSTIGFIGGLIGLIISLIASFVLNHLSVLGQGFDLSGIMGGGYYMGGDGSAAISIIPPWLMLAALVFATLVGLVAGILPANKAVKISALEAIRHD